MALELNDIKSKIYQYVESRMAFIAPNLSAIVGAGTAAKLMGKLKQKIFDDEEFLNLMFDLYLLI